MTPDYWPRAKRALARRDPVLGAIIRANPRVALARRGDPFSTLARSIVGQQISVKAAQSVWDRLAAKAVLMTPECIARIDSAGLRSCGLSERKAGYLHALAQCFRDGRLNVERWPEWQDEAVIEDLIQVRGIGRWTAEMFLIFHLLRPNVLPLGDLGLQNAIRLHYGNGRALSDRRVRILTASWAPWCSVATWFLWRSLDPLPVEY